MSEATSDRLAAEPARLGRQRSLPRARAGGLLYAPASPKATALQAKQHPPSLKHDGGLASEFLHHSSMNIAKEDGTRQLQQEVKEEAAAEERERGEQEEDGEDGEEANERRAWEADSASRRLPRLDPTSISPLPSASASPVPPRWDSLNNGTSAILYDPAAPRRSPTSLGPIAAKTSTVKAARPVFPGLSSHPFSPEPPFLGSPSSSPSRDAFVQPSLNSPTVSTAGRSYMSDQRPSTAATDGSMTVDNFSRPRKPSIKRSNPDLFLNASRVPHAADSQPLDQPSNGNQPPASSAHPRDWARTRGLSNASSQSASTFSSSLAQRPSNDHLGGASRPGSVRKASGLGRPAIAYNTTGASSNPRDHLPWVHDENEELRSSFRSQLTVSTAQGTLFTNSGTERSSVLTKTSSVTDVSFTYAFARHSAVDDDGLSVEEVMGMYERGFVDDSEAGEDDLYARASAFRARNEDDEDDTHELDVGVGAFDADSRPATANPELERMSAKVLEAMSDSLLLPGARGLGPAAHFVARDSAAIFRNSGLPGSILDEEGVNDTPEQTTAKRRAKLEAAQAEGKHDSAKSLPTGVSVSIRKQASSPTMRSKTPSPVQQSGARQATPPSANPPVGATLPQPPPEDPMARDRYGFRKANAYITREQYDEWDDTYSEYLARRQKKWIAFLKDQALATETPEQFPAPSAKTKRFIRKGIPPEWRGAAWFFYAGGPAILAKHPGVYDDLLRRAGVAKSFGGKTVVEDGEMKPLVVEDIEKDLHRTFPDNIRFNPPQSSSKAAPAPSNDGQQSESAVPAEAPQEVATISSLRRVLRAFALYNPRIGYCQSLNFLAGLLLLFVEKEEHAFWLLNIITRVYLPGTHEMSLEGSKVDLGVLMAALKDALPSVWKQIASDEAEGAGLDSKPKHKKPKKGSKADIDSAAASVAVGDPNRLPAITLCMTAWFMSCFIGTLPIESTLRVWDIFFYEGSRTLFRIALAIFKVGEAEIKAVSDPMEMFGVVQALPRRLLDCNTLMEACYKRRNGIGHLSQETVEVRRRERRNSIRRWKAEQEAPPGAGTNSAYPTSPTADDGFLTSPTTAGLDLMVDLTEVDVVEVRRKGTLFGRRKDRDRERLRAVEVL